MNDNIGTIIKYNRIKNNMSQSELAQGICVPSYLSKIENNEIQAGKSVLDMLLEKLSVDIFEISDNELLFELINKIENVDKAHAKKIFGTIEKDYTKSLYIYEYLAIDMYLNNTKDENDIHIVESGIDYISPKRAAFLLVLLYGITKNSDFLDKSIYTYKSGFGYYTLGLEYYNQKNFDKAYNAFDKAQYYYSERGFLKGQIQSMKQKGIILNLKEDYDEALNFFMSISRILSYTSDNVLTREKVSNRYNIEYFKYKLGLKNELIDICKEYVENNTFKNSVAHLMLVEIYMESDKASAQKYLDRGLNRFTNPQSIDYKLLKLNDIKLKNPDYIKDKKYYNKLKEIISISEKEKLYSTLFILRKELIACLKRNRRYKEVLKLISNEQL